MNQAFALALVRELTAAGVREFCVCPGARNSPLSALLLELRSADLRVLHFFEERSASFFALGRIKATRRPVAVVTTSGTAAGELLPATMEAHYTGLPLLLLTADRPRRFRGSGAPQTAEQPAIFGVYVERSVDLAAPEALDLSHWSLARPLHVNACFEEPLLDRSAQADVSAFHLPETREPRVEDAAPMGRARAALRAFLESARHPLAIIGGLRAEDRASVRALLLQTGMPAYFEGPSGLREDARLADQRVHVSDGSLSRAREGDYPVDGVLRIGSVPTLRLWRDLEMRRDAPVLSLSREPFSGLSWSSIEAVSIARVIAELLPTMNAKEPRAFTSESRGPADAFLLEDHRVQARLDALFAEHPRAEPALFRALSELIARAPSRVFIGNSLPIREWDLAASFSRGEHACEIGSSRGLNGIDGQASTFLGHCQPGVKNWGILGDLTTLYDLSAPWIVPQLEAGMEATLVVVNNSGGKIFARMFPQAEFQNTHALHFGQWASMWNLPYERWGEVPRVDSAASTASLRIVELIPDTGETDRFWQSADALWR